MFSKCLLHLVMVVGSLGGVLSQPAVLEGAHSSKERLSASTRNAEDNIAATAQQDETALQNVEAKDPMPFPIPGFGFPPAYGIHPAGANFPPGGPVGNYQLPGYPGYFPQGLGPLSPAQNYPGIGGFPSIPPPGGFPTNPQSFSGPAFPSSNVFAGAQGQTNQGYVMPGGGGYLTTTLQGQGLSAAELASSNAVPQGQGLPGQGFIVPGQGFPAQPVFGNNVHPFGGQPFPQGFPGQGFPTPQGLPPGYFPGQFDEVVKPQSDTPAEPSNLRLTSGTVYGADGGYVYEKP